MTRYAVAVVSTLFAVTLWSATAPVSAGAWTAQDDEFPEGAGRKILLDACTSCHDLDEVSKFKGYYTRAQWRDVVVTMVDYGARVRDGDIDVLADYLNEHFGRK
jgi:mono/diheme cytochrome c family protein